jgi:hypothetical protein
VRRWVAHLTNKPNAYPLFIHFFHHYPADGIKPSKSADRIRPKKVDSVQIAVEELERERRKLEEEKARLAAQKEQLNKRGSGKDRGVF